MKDNDQSLDAPSDRTIRRGTVSWLTHPPEGVAHITAESHAFHGLPVSVPEGDPVPYESTPGELLAITHAMFMAWMLAEGLAEGGTPANERIVDAQCSFDGPVTSRRLIAVDVSVRGRVPGLGPQAFDEAANIARRRYLRASGVRDDVPGGLEAVLVEPYQTR